MNKCFKYLPVLIMLSFGAGLFAQDDYGIRVRHFNIDKYHVALEGYDVVSYYLGKPEKGVARIYHFHKGIRYEFKSQSNLSLFKAAPSKYEPAYGGWCAYAMGKNGEKVEVDPLKYKITNGRLYLFYHSIINNTLEKWNADENRLKIQADKNWNKLTGANL